MVQSKRALFWLPAALVFSFNLLFFNRYFPICEGWIETYAYLINSGMKPYRDFNIAFPPLYIFIFSAYLKYITNSFLVLRLIGIVFDVLVILFLQYFLEGFFPRRVAAVATIFAAFLSISNPTFIAKDYHTYLDLFIIVSLIIGQRITNVASIDAGSEKTKEFPKNLAVIFWATFLGFTTGLAILTKQNVGIFLALAYVICIAYTAYPSWKNALISLSFYSSGIFAAVFLLLLHYAIVNNIPIDSMNQIFLSNDSKGSIFVVLTRFITERFNRHVIILGVFIAYVYVLIKKFPYLAQAHNYVKKINLYNYFLLNIIAILSLLGLSQITILRHTYNDLILPVSLGTLFIIILQVFYFKERNLDKKKYLFVIAPLLALAYSNTHTAGFNATGMFYVIAFSFGYFLFSAKNTLKIKEWLLYLPILCVIPSIIFNKCILPYDWWGLQQSNIFSARYSLPYKELKGIYVDKDTRDVFAEVKESIDAYSRDDRDVYLVPNIPIFYYLHKKYPPYRNVVQWFDVTSTKNMTDEMNRFKNKHPNLVVFLDPPESVYAGHANMIRKELLLDDFGKLMDDLVRNGEYELVKYTIYDQKLGEPYRNFGKYLTSDVIVLNDKLIGAPFTALGDKTVMHSGGSINYLKRDGFVYKPVDNTTLKRFDTINVTMSMCKYKEYIESIGMLAGKDYYTMKIYHRKTKAP